MRKLNVKLIIEARFKFLLYKIIGLKGSSVYFVDVVEM